MIAGIALVIAGIVLFFRHRAAVSVRRRDALIADARSEESFFGGQRDNRAVSRALDEAILRLFRLLGCAPESGELHVEYADRIDREYGALSRHPMREILPLIEKEEFGDGLSLAEMKNVAQYYEELTEAVYRGLSLPRRFLMRCIHQAL